MAITMNGQTFRTLDDELYLNGKRIVAAHAGGTLVYPDAGEHASKISGSFSYDSSHVHNGDASKSAVLQSSVSNSLSISYTGTFRYASFTEDTIELWPGDFGWDKENDGITTSSYGGMSSYGYGYVTSSSNVPPAIIGANDSEYSLYRRSGSFTPVGTVSIDIDMPVPQFCQPLRVYKSDKFGKATSSFASNFINTVSGHYEVQENQWTVYGRDAWNTVLASNADGEYVTAFIANVGTLLGIRIVAKVETTKTWEYSRKYEYGRYVVRPISDVETEQYLYGFDGPYKGSTDANYYAPSTNIEDLY